MPKGKTHVEHHGINFHGGWPKDVFWTWFAGYFDGEGSIRTTPDGVELSVSSINRDVIMSLHQFIGAGYVEQIDFNDDRWNTKFTLRIRRYADARTVLINIRPYLTIKVEACDKAFIRIAEAAHRHEAMRLRHADVVRRSEAGASHQEIADKVGLSRTAVTVIVNRAADRGLTADEIEQQQDAPLFMRDIKRYDQRRGHEQQRQKTTRRRLTPK